MTRSTAQLAYLLPGVLAFAAGVLLRDVAQDFRSPMLAECTYSAPIVTHDPPLMQFTPLDLVCQHYRATGRGHLCRQVDL